MSHKCFIFAHHIDTNLLKTPYTMEEKNIRRAAVAGQFYPADREEAIKELNHYFSPFEDCKRRDDIRALIVPHAGWVFSGEVAASAFARINPEKVYDRIFLIGPSHQVYLNAASVDTASTHYSTPLGEVELDTALCRQLAQNERLFKYDKGAHLREHCLEVELPFLQYHLKTMPPIVPIIIATDDIPKLIDLNEALLPYFNERNLWVVSSDFSHYPDYDDACKVDMRTAEAITSGNVQMLANIIDRNEREHIHGLSTSACGFSAIFTLLLCTHRDSTMKVEHIMYRNSGDSRYGDKQRVVGYNAFIVYPEKSNPMAFSLTKEEMRTLLFIARESITSACNKRPMQHIDINDNLHKKLGAFVTLHKDDRLRGCIGHFGEDVPLYRIVEEMAQAAAFDDPRFPKVTADELEDIVIEISVLTPLKRIQNADEFVYGKQGIYMRKGYHSGTFLPQVAHEVDWTKEEFLGHCARDKAGIGWNGWRDAELYTYEAILFEEG